MKKVLVTSALPYANGKVHLGHLAGAYLPADIFVRHLRLQGCSVKFVCGSDEHGVPITLTALKRNLTPQQVVDEYHALNGAAFEAADVRFDIWSRTSSPEHHVLTQEFFKRLYEKGYIEKRQTQQLYSEKLKMFLPDRYVEGACPVCRDPNARGGECEACGATFEAAELIEPRVAIEGDGSRPVLRETAHWFIKLDSLQGRVREFIESHGAGGSHPWRENVLREARGWMATGLQPRSITRDTTWGVKIPLPDPDVEGKSIFVWFDAPIGYVTFTRQLMAKEGQPEAWKDYWQNPECEIYNFIGKDNKWFHAIFWPAMLMAANEAVPPGEKPYQLATEVVASEFLLFGGEKGSKTRGNAVEIDAFASRFGSEALRYYLTAIGPEANDSSFTWPDFMQRFNGELADVLGNYIHRVLTFTVNKLGGQVPDPNSGADPAFMDETATAVSNASALLDDCQFRNALATIMACARAGNVYFDGHAPWKLLKSDTAACDRVLYACLCRAAAIGLMLRPILPKSASAILKNFGLADPLIPGSGGLKPEDVCKPGTVLQKPEVLFKKLEEKDLPEVKA